MGNVVCKTSHKTSKGLSVKTDPGGPAQAGDDAKLAQDTAQTRTLYMARLQNAKARAMDCEPNVYVYAQSLETQMEMPIYRSTHTQSRASQDSHRTHIKLIRRLMHTIQTHTRFIGFTKSTIRFAHATI